MSATAIKRERLDCAEIAKRLRRELKAAFPGTTFSVRSRRYSGGSSVDVHWTDGPRTKPVQALCDRYAFRHFDGSDDSTHFSSEMVVRDGELIEQTGGSFIFATRKWSEATRDRIAGDLWTRYGYAYTPGERAESGSVNPDHLVTLDGSSSVEALGGGTFGGRENLWTLAHRYFSLWDGMTGEYACWQCDKSHPRDRDCYAAAEGGR